MYMSQPMPDTLEPEVTNDNQLSFRIDKQNIDVPAHVDHTLFKLGWEVSTYHPETNETLYRKQPPVSCTAEVRAKWHHDLQFGHWYWYEAMSYEFAKFINIGEDG